MADDTKIMGSIHSDNSSVKSKAGEVLEVLLSILMKAAG